MAEVASYRMVGWDHKALESHFRNFSVLTPFLRAPSSLSISFYFQDFFLRNQQNTREGLVESPRQDGQGQRQSVSW